MAMTSVSGVRLYYYRRGVPDRPHVVLVHGLATNSAFWFPWLVAPLARNHLVTAYDLRGHGRSEMPAAGYTIDDMVSDLEAVVDQIHPIHLISHSYGGVVALQYAMLHPNRVTSLIVADTRLGAFQPTLRLSGWLAGRDPRGGQPPRDEKTEPNPRLRFSFPFRQSAISARTVDRWLALVRTTTALQDIRATAGPSVEDLTQLDTPTLAIFGEHSRQLLRSCEGLERHLPRCRAVVVPGAGHFHPRVKSDFFLREVGTFLNEATTERPR